MSKQVTIFLPDGYEDADYAVLVDANRHVGPKAEWAAHVIRLNVEPDANSEVEEIGIAGALNALMLDAAKVIRKDAS
jgi:hypothetical protein